MIKSEENYSERCAVQSYSLPVDTWILNFAEKQSLRSVDFFVSFFSDLVTEMLVEDVVIETKMSKLA